MTTHQPPHIDIQGNREAFSDYLQRISSLYTNIPMDIHREWTWRHWNAFKDAYDSRDLGNCSFSIEIWHKDQVMKIHSQSDSDLSEWWELFMDNSYWRGTWLAQYMLRERCWPAPIIVMDNFLLEGHRRLGYFKAMVNHGERVADYHPVWVCRRNKTKGY